MWSVWGGDVAAQVDEGIRYHKMPLFDLEGTGTLDSYCFRMNRFGRFHRMPRGVPGEKGPTFLIRPSARCAMRTQGLLFGGCDGTQPQAEGENGALFPTCASEHLPLVSICPPRPLLVSPLELRLGLRSALVGLHDG